MKTWLVGLGAALLAVTMFAFSPGSSAVVYADEEYCGNDFVSVPDSGDAFNFTDACQAHDECYATYAGQGEQARAACDRAFLSAMIASCDAMWSRLSGNYLKCRTVASIYYTGVRLGGWLFF